MLLLTTVGCTTSEGRWVGDVDLTTVEGYEYDVELTLDVFNDSGDVVAAELDGEYGSCSEDVSLSGVRQGTRLTLSGDFVAEEMSVDVAVEATVDGDRMVGDLTVQWGGSDYAGEFTLLRY